MGRPVLDVAHRTPLTIPDTHSHQVAVDAVVNTDHMTGKHISRGPIRTPNTMGWDIRTEPRYDSRVLGKLGALEGSGDKIHHDALLDAAPTPRSLDSPYPCFELDILP